MAEWSIAAVLKTANPKGFRGSNPLLSSIRFKIGLRWIPKWPKVDTR